MVADMPTLQAVNGFLGKSDGRDKLTATLQYVCMFISAGQPGLAKDVQVKIAAARKVFRILKMLELQASGSADCSCIGARQPLEVLTPLIKEPYLPGKQNPVLELLPKLKSALMAVYFGCDHLVWLGSVNVITDKKMLERAQKTSLWGWFLGSICTTIQEVIAVLQGAARRKPDESDEEWAQRRHAAAEATSKHLLVLVHAVIQAFLAMGLLQLRPFKPRTVGMFGVLASAINCYMLFPPGAKPRLLADAPKVVAKVA